MASVFASSWIAGASHPRSHCTTVLATSSPLPVPPEIMTIIKSSTSIMIHLLRYRYPLPPVTPVHILGSDIKQTAEVEKTIRVSLLYPVELSRPQKGVVVLLLTLQASVRLLRFPRLLKRGREAKPCL
jgi:hypothetical protein